jgi:hypothetical protein
VNVLTYVIAAAIVALGVQTLRLGSAQREIATLGATLDKERREAADRALAAERTARDEEARRLELLGRIDRETAARNQRRLDDAAAVVVAGGGLRQRAATVAARCEAPRDPAAAVDRPAANDAGVVLADVLGRLEETARRLAALADERGTAGDACERAYDALGR